MELRSIKNKKRRLPEIKNKNTKMKMFNKIALVTLISMVALVSRAQQDPMYTQYIFNLQTVNPAYARYWQTMGFMALTRVQWVGITGHPTTQTLSFQAPLKSKKVGVGFDAIYDVVGLEKRISLHFDYSYEIELYNQTTLRLGLDGGFTNYCHNLLDYQQYPDGISDPAFQITVKNQFMPNFGVGFFLSNPKYFLSLSLPKIIENNYASNSNNFSISAEKRHLYFAGGMVFNLSDAVVFKPTFMTQIVTGAPVLYDLSANFLLANRLWLGGMYRSGDAVSAIVQWVLTKNLRIGYAHDFSTTDLSNYHSGIHEIMLSFEFSALRVNFISPRYF